MEYYEALKKQKQKIHGMKNIEWGRNIPMLEVKEL